MARDLLPVGSVVQLAESNTLVMVAGYLPISPKRPDYVWDYSGVRFPVGYVDEEGIYCFDHAQVETIYAYGYRDAEYDIFMSRMNAVRDDVSQTAKDRAANAEKED